LFKIIWVVEWFLLFLFCLSYLPQSYSGQAKTGGEKLGMHTFH
jgi:hypothetical protein